MSASLYAEAQHRLMEDLFGELIESWGIQPGTPNHATALKYCTSNVSRHNFRDVDEQAVARRLRGIAQKRAFAGRPADATRLLTLASAATGSDVAGADATLYDSVGGDGEKEAPLSPPLANPYDVLAALLELAGSKQTMLAPHTAATAVAAAGTAAAHVGSSFDAGVLPPLDRLERTAAASGGFFAAGVADDDDNGYGAYGGVYGGAYGSGYSDGDDGDDSADWGDTGDDSDFDDLEAGSDEPAKLPGFPAAVASAAAPDASVPSESAKAVGPIAWSWVEAAAVTEPFTARTAAIVASDLSGLSRPTCHPDRVAAVEGSTPSRLPPAAGAGHAASGVAAAAAAAAATAATAAAAAARAVAQGPWELLPQQLLGACDSAAVTGGAGSITFAGGSGLLLPRPTPVSEAEVVLAVLGMLQGLEGPLFRRERRARCRCGGGAAAPDFAPAAAAAVSAAPGAVAAADVAASAAAADGDCGIPHYVLAPAARGVALTHLSPSALRSVLAWFISVADAAEYLRRLRDDLCENAAAWLGDESGAADAAGGGESGSDIGCIGSSAEEGWQRRRRRRKYGQVMEAFAVEVTASSLGLLEADVAALERGLLALMRGDGDDSAGGADGRYGGDNDAVHTLLGLRTRLQPRCRHVYEARALVHAAMGWWVQNCCPGEGFDSDEGGSGGGGGNDVGTVAAFAASAMRVRTMRLLSVLYRSWSDAALLQPKVLLSPAPPSLPPPPRFPLLPSPPTPSTSAQTLDEGPLADAKNDSDSAAGEISADWLLRLFRAAAAPYLRFIGEFLADARLNDPAEELFFSGGEPHGGRTGTVAAAAAVGLVRLRGTTKAQAAAMAAAAMEASRQDELHAEDQCLRLFPSAVPNFLADVAEDIALGGVSLVLLRRLGLQHLPGSVGSDRGDGGDSGDRTDSDESGRDGGYGIGGSVAEPTTLGVDATAGPLAVAAASSAAVAPSAVSVDTSWFRGLKGGGGGSVVERDAGDGGDSGNSGDERDGDAGSNCGDGSRDDRVRNDCNDAHDGGGDIEDGDARGSAAPAADDGNPGKAAVAVHGGDDLGDRAALRRLTALLTDTTALARQAIHPVFSDGRLTGAAYSGAGADSAANAQRLGADFAACRDAGRYGGGGGGHGVALLRVSPGLPVPAALEASLLNPLRWRCRELGRACVPAVLREAGLEQLLLALRGVFLMVSHDAMRRFSTVVFAGLSSCAALCPESAPASRAAVAVAAAHGATTAGGKWSSVQVDGTLIRDLRGLLSDSKRLTGLLRSSLLAAATRGDGSLDPCTGALAVCIGGSGGGSSDAGMNGDGAGSGGSGGECGSETPLASLFSVSFEPDRLGDEHWADNGTHPTRGSSLARDSVGGGSSGAAAAAATAVAVAPGYPLLPSGAGVDIRALSCLSVACAVPWPLGAIVDRAALDRYAGVLTLLFQLEFCLDELSDLHHRQRRRRQAPGGPGPAGRNPWRLLDVRLSALLRVVRALHGYARAQAADREWVKLRRGLAGAASLAVAAARHRRYIRTVAERCFLLLPRQRAAAAHMLDMLQGALNFVGCCRHGRPPETAAAVVAATATEESAAAAAAVRTMEPASAAERTGGAECSSSSGGGSGGNGGSVGAAFTAEADRAYEGFARDFGAFCNAMRRLRDSGRAAYVEELLVSLPDSLPCVANAAMRMEILF